MNEKNEPSKYNLFIRNETVRGMKEKKVKFVLHVEP